MHDVRPSIRAVFIAGTLAGLLASERAVAAEAVRMRADFAAAVDYPLVKSKFGVFNSGIVPAARYERDARLYGEVRPDSLRVDLGWGGHWAGWTTEPVSGDARAPRFEFAETDRIADVLRGQDVLPYWSYCYVPDPLQPRRRGWREAPADAATWEPVMAAFAARYARGGDRPAGYHEVYNEPDNRDFFRGGLDQYLKMYRAAAPVIRVADPNGPVGGPALAFTGDWVEPFCAAVAAGGLPLDFFSFHFYPGVEYPERELAAVVDRVKRTLDRHPELRTAEMHLNEYNSYKIDYPRGGRQDRFPLAAAFLADAAYFVAQPALTRVHWAQFQDSGQGNFSGMISIDGHRKAVFNACRIYAMMPVDRRRLTIENAPPGVAGLASADATRAAAVVWNRSAADADVTVRFDRLPFDGGRVRLYRIDAHHASWGDDPAREELSAELAGLAPRDRTFTWSGPIPKDGVVYLQADAGDAEPPALAPLAPPPARLIRELHDFPDRSTRAYADFDRRTWVARLGMAGEESADARAGMTVDKLPARMRVDVDATGLRTGADATLAVRVDYQGHGGYVRAVTFHGPVGGVDLYNEQRHPAFPWGTSRPPERTVAVAVAELSRFTIDFAAHAPPDWTGRAQITVVLRNAGGGARAKVSFTKAD